MHEIDSPGSVAGKFEDENPELNKPGTLLWAKWLNNLQAECMSILLARGIAPDATKNDQILKAILELVSGVDIMARFTTTANINLAGNGLQAGGDWSAPLPVGTIILAKNQTLSQYNGPYVVAESNWYRLPIFDSSDEVIPGKTIKVTEGNTLADSIWMLTTDGPIVVGTTPLTFVRKDAMSYFIGAAAGTADAITATVQDYSGADGMPIFIKAALANMLTNPTLAINGGAALPIVKGNDLALIAGDIAGASHWLLIQKDVTLNKYVLLNPAKGILGGIGVNQSYQDVTVSRALDTTYTNNTGKPIEVKVQVYPVGNRSATALVNGVVVDFVKHYGTNDVGYESTLKFIVPHLGTYRVNQSAATVAMNRWTELR